MTDRVVIAIGGDGANDAIRGMMMAYGAALESVGTPVVHINMEISELEYALQQIQQGKVIFAFTWLGFGQDLTCLVNDRQVNMWEATGVPLLKLHGDHPAYFIERHSDTPGTAVNLYAASEFIHFRQRWLKEMRALTGLLPPMPLATIPRADVDIGRRRKGTAVFLKNGNDPRELQHLWRSALPDRLAHALLAMAEELSLIGVRAGPLHIGDFVATYMEEQGIAPNSAAYYIPFFTAQLDDYLRRLKSEMIARAILDLPVIVQGNNWGHVDFSNRRATLVPGQDFASSQSAFSDQLAVIDMSPNLDSGPHERIMRAAGSYCAPLTNRQGWIKASLDDFDDLQFDFTPDSIRQRVEDLLTNPDRYIDRAISFGTRFRERFPQNRVGEALLELGQLAALRWSKTKPRLQPFFIWPNPSTH